MNAGTEASGSQDAWWETYLTMAHCRIAGVPFSGGASDIYKCFDQLPRHLVYHLAYVAGMPRKVITAYCNYQKQMTVRNGFALGLGQPHRRDNGIPQGWPMSMM